jgi:hypothetical protein
VTRSDDASVWSASGGCADTLKACPPGRSLLTAHSNSNRYKIYFNLALFVCTAVIKWADDDARDSDYKQISRHTNNAPALMRRALCAFVQWMR